MAQSEHLRRISRQHQVIIVQEQNCRTMGYGHAKVPGSSRPGRPFVTDKAQPRVINKGKRLFSGCSAAIIDDDHLALVWQGQ